MKLARLHVPRRPAARIALLALVLLALDAGGRAARAQDAEEAAPEPEAAAEAAPAPVEDYSKPMGPPDPYNRGTPQGSMYGYLAAAREGDYERAAAYLDLRQLPPGQRDQGPELARRLKVVLDQTLWVDLSSLSDTNAGTTDDGLPAWQDAIGEIETPDGPRTLLLQRVPRKGDGVRIWKVAASTVEQVPALYQDFEPVWLETWLPGVFFDRELFQVEVWKLIALVLLAVVAWTVALLIGGTTARIFGMLVSRGRRVPDARIVQLVRGPVRLAWTVILFALAHPWLGLSLGFVAGLRLAEHLLLVLAAAWLVFRLIDLAVLVLRARSEGRGNMGLVPILLPGARFAKLVILLIGFLGVLGTLGVNISAAVAGLGVGGIAVALAAQKTLENLFGGISLFADRPVMVGDFFRYGDAVGTVEEIGLRSTRVRTLDRTVVTIPNAEFSNLRLENFAKRDRMRLWAMIGVRYETTPDQLRYLLARLREILLAHPRVTEDPARVRFVGFGAYSLDLEVFAYVDTANWDEFLAIREDIYLLFMDAVDDAGTGFAFPSSTMYLGRDEGVDGERSQRAEQRVARWREEGQLPFPEFPAERRRQVWDSLAWPPSGSPDARRSD